MIWSRLDSNQRYADFVGRDTITQQLQYDVPSFQLPGNHTQEAESYWYLSCLDQFV